jgi:hypothetical protein
MVFSKVNFTTKSLTSKWVFKYPSETTRIIESSGATGTSLLRQDPVLKGQLEALSSGAYHRHDRAEDMDWSQATCD